MSAIPKGAILTVEFECLLPVDATDEQIEEWLVFNLRGGSIAGDNPLMNFSPDVWGGSSAQWDWNGEYGREERGPERKTERGIAYSVRYIRSRTP